MMTGWTEKSNYTGDCAIRRMVWNMDEENEGSTWGAMRSVIALHEDRHSPFSEDNIRRCAEHLLDGIYPVFDVGTQLNVYVRKWGDWDAFIRSWAEAYACIEGGEGRAEDEEEMAEMLEDACFEAIEGETVDEFNTRLWLYEVEGMEDALGDDFNELKERLECARTMHLAQTGETAA
jgi:hypothetical protein